MQKSIIQILNDQGLRGKSGVIIDEPIYHGWEPGDDVINQDVENFLFNEKQIDGGVDQSHITNLKEENKLPKNTLGLLYGLSIEFDTDLTEDQIRAFYSAHPVLEVKQGESRICKVRVRELPETNPLQVFAALDGASSVVAVSHANVARGYYDITSYDVRKNERVPVPIEGGVEFSAILKFKDTNGLPAATFVDGDLIFFKLHMLQVKIEN